MYDTASCVAILFCSTKYKYTLSHSRHDDDEERRKKGQIRTYANVREETCESCNTMTYYLSLLYTAIGANVVDVFYSYDSSSVFLQGTFFSTLIIHSRIANQQRRLVFPRERRIKIKSSFTFTPFSTSHTTHLRWMDQFSFSKMSATIHRSF